MSAVVVPLFPEPCKCFVCGLRDLDQRLHALSASGLLIGAEDVAELADVLHGLTHRADVYVRRVEDTR